MNGPDQRVTDALRSTAVDLMELGLEPTHVFLAMLSMGASAMSHAIGSNATAEMMHGMAESLKDLDPVVLQ